VNIDRISQSWKNKSISKIEMSDLSYLPMSTQQAHLEENLKALDLEISPEDILALDHIELPEDRLWPV